MRIASRPESLFTLNAARHRAETTSHVVRNTTIAAAAGAAMIGSVAPAQAFAQAPVETGAAYSAPASASLAEYSSYTYQAPVAAQTNAAISTRPTTTADICASNVRLSHSWQRASILPLRQW